MQQHIDPMIMFGQTSLDGLQPRICMMGTPLISHAKLAAKVTKVWVWGLAGQLLDAVWGSSPSSGLSGFCIISQSDTLALASLKFFSPQLAVTLYQCPVPIPRSSQMCSAWEQCRPRWGTGPGWSEGPAWSFHRANGGLLGLQRKRAACHPEVLILSNNAWSWAWPCKVQPAGNSLVKTPLGREAVGMRKWPWESPGEVSGSRLVGCCLPVSPCADLLGLQACPTSLVDGVTGRQPRVPAACWSSLHVYDINPSTRQIWGIERY